ncbi:NAD(+)/NADH kinase [Plantibacter sp. ME-Dv--P-122b]|uniref:ATP-NAD kinase family protein n=1 Tax=Plantibacter sp. ME-Dv--P-122b TaxID=3040300 RepID=UPI002549F6CA|nr:NAD(+)/NADH kinase [Plantibacter sp. ME-Dv--P-122b]
MSVPVGVLVNPIAGFGGPRGLHGTDGLTDEQYAVAVSEGRSTERLLRAVRHLRAATDVELIAAAGVLGSDALTRADIPHRTVGAEPARRTTGVDSIAAVQSLQRAGARAVLFAGGDGTALDLASALGPEVPMIGVPAGVKMHSEAFARSPEGAGRLAAQYVSGNATLVWAEVLDVDDEGVSRPMAVVRVPRGGEPLQRAKSMTPASAGRAAVAQDVVDGADPGSTWIIGPGTGAGAVAEALGFTATLRGVDLRHASGEVELDVDESRLLHVARTVPGTRIVLGVVGGQGFLLGRGNQQLSRAVVDAVGAEHVDIVATTEKVGALLPPVLYVDDDGAGGTHPLLGYRRVRVGRRESTVMRVLDAAAETLPTTSIPARR